MLKMLPRRENVPKMHLKGENVPKMLSRGGECAKDTLQGEIVLKMLPRREIVPKTLSKTENVPKIISRGGEYAKFFLEFLEREILPNKVRREKILIDYEGIYAKMCQEGESSKRESMPNI